MNIYARLHQLRRAINIGSDHTGEDDRLLDVAAQMSRAVDDYLGYQAYERRVTFYLSLERYTERNGWGRLAWFGRPVVSVESIEADSDGDGVYDLALSGSDYVLEPEGAADIQRAYSRLCLLPAAPLPAIPTWPRGMKVVAVTGQPCRKATVQLTLTCDATSTLVTVTGSPTGVIYPGDVIEVDAERMYVEAVTGSTLTVRRGINGFDAASHSGAAVRVIEPPMVLTRALLAWVGRMAWDELSGYQGSVILTDAGAGGAGMRSTTPWTAIRALLDPYRKAVFA